MATISATPDQPKAPFFSDGLGHRVVTADGATGELLQVLHLRPILTSVPSFEFALRERAARLANFRHASYARVRRVDRTMTPSAPLAIVSDHVEGVRLSELLRIAEEHRLQLDTNAALYLIGQLVSAVALLHENARDAAHGLVAPERIVVTPQGRLVLVEHVLGAAIEQLHYGRDRLWQEFRIAMPATAGLPRFDHRADVAGIGSVALALLLGRPLAHDEHPYQVTALLNQGPARLGDASQPLSPGLRGWISRALQLELRRAFASASEAATALEEVLAAEPQFVAAPVALEMFLSRYGTALLEPSAASTRPPAADVLPPAVREAQLLVEPLSATVVAVPEPLLISMAPPKLEELIDLSELDIPGQTPDAAPPAAVNPAPESDELLPASVEAEPRDDAQPLFNPDAPFTVPMPLRQPAKSAPGFRSRTATAVAAALILIAGGALAAAVYLGGESATPALGTLTVTSNPSGVPVSVDGVDRGVTPARITLAPGSHILELRRGVPRVIPFTLSAGAEVSQYLEFAEAPLLGHLAVQSEPAGARVFVNGIERGVTPVTLDDLTPGEHDVMLQTELAVSRHRVTVAAGGTASLVVPIAGAASGPVSGWIAIKAPFRIEIHEQGRLLGTNDAERLMLSAGRHELEFVNASLAYKVTRVVQVPPGRTASIELELPRGVVSLNASPWAEVWINGERVGDTPLGNLSMPIGAHELVFRHPQFGEKRHAISVTLGAPVRVSVDMKQE
jgi:hypothetical protein